ncbi:MAG: hypothetical protein U7M05_12565 [Candidatus Igneacidithiobacillus chanchocoensis]
MSKAKETASNRMQRPTPEVKKAIRDILNRKASIAQETDQIKEDIKAVALAMGAKPAAVNKIISLIEKEKAKGGVIDSERDILDFADEVSS